MKKIQTFSNLCSEINQKSRKELCIRILASFLNADIASVITSTDLKSLKKHSENSKVAKIIGDEILDSVSVPLGKKLKTLS
jgi:hypothetical protein